MSVLLAVEIMALGINLVHLFASWQPCALGVVIPLGMVTALFLYGTGKLVRLRRSLRRERALFE